MIPTLATVATLTLVLVTAAAQQVNISSEGGCLRCGGPCLDSVTDALPNCIAPLLAAAGAAVGVPVPDLGISLAGGGVVDCVRGLVGATPECRDCVESLVCCVTDSCSFCECDCHNLLRFTAPLSSPTREEHPWLFSDQCHFVYIGTPACEDCDGKRVYKSVECEKQVYLHYHDYILDGRWVVTADLDSDDTAAVVRNLGDGWDDEECPEKESYVWQLRSRRAPDAGWIGDSQLRLEQYIKEKDLIRKAKLLIKADDGVVKIN